MNRHYLVIRGDVSLPEAASVAMVTRLHRLEEIMTHLAAGPCTRQRTDEEVALVHDLRVASRRALAALRLFRDVFAEKAYRRCRRMVRRLRRSAGTLRDLDILRERLSGLPYASLADWMRRRIEPMRDRAGQDVYQCVLATLGSKKWFRAYRKLHASWLHAGPRTAENDFRTWAELQWRQLAEQLCRQVPGTEDDWSAWHKFRIAVKQVRYTAELVAPVVAPARDCHGALEHIQEQLGKANDLVLCRNMILGLRADLPRTLHAACDDLLELWQQEIATLKKAALDHWTANSLATEGQSWSRTLRDSGRFAATQTVPKTESVE